jgi:hypothetical protein
LTSFFVTAAFTSPEPVGVDVWAVLWLLPLSAAIAVCYKATKVRTIRTADFLKQSGALFASIVGFMAVAGVVLAALAYVLT